MKIRTEKSNDGGEVVRYDTELTDTGQDVKTAWTHADHAAKMGARICLTDLIGASERQHIKTIEKRKPWAALLSQKQ